MREQDERGFALVMTMAILAGMLIIIVPLVMINNMRYREGKVAEAEALSRYGIDSARNLTQFINQRNGGRDLSGFSKTVILPGWRDIPLPLYGSSKDTVANFVPAFLMMSTPLGQIGANNRLNGDAGHKFNKPFLNLPAGVNVSDNEWFLAGGELLSRNKRCIMGRLSSHRALETIYGVPRANYNQCWVKINGKWGRILSVKYNNDMSAVLKLSDGLSINRNDTVEFYPARIHNKYDHNVDLDVRVRVIDERSKINISSMTNRVSNQLGLNVGLNRSLPYVSPITMKADGASVDKMIDTMPIITSYSSPDYTFIKKNGIYGQRESYNGVMKVNGKRIYQHPVNINTASVNVLGIIFSAMDIKNPYPLANAIVMYRSGGGDNFDGNENPFDGYNPKKAGDNKYYVSPWEEFADFLRPRTTKADRYKILQHLYAFGNLAKYKGLGTKSTPLCFEIDHVQTANITSRVMSGKRPLVEEKATVVSREVYHDMENETRGRIIIDSDNGWNQGMSTFYGIEWRQPQIIGFNKQRKNITFKFDQHNQNDTWTASPTLGPGLLGRLNTYESVYINYIKKYEANEIKVRAKNVDFLTNGVRRLDFGLRVMTRPDHMTKIAKLKITGNKNKFKVEPGNKFLRADIPGRRFMFVPPNDGEPKIIKYSGGHDNYRSNKNFKADPGHEAYLLPNYGYNNNEELYPNGVPYYETVIIREGAVWESVRWDTIKNGPTILHVTVNGNRYKWETDKNGGGANIWSYFVNNLDSKGITGKFLRLRFEFTDKSNRDGNYLGGCPQLFRIHVQYTLPDNKPRRIVLDQR